METVAILFFLLVSTMHVLASSAARALDESNSFRFELIHRHDHLFPNTPMTHWERIQDLIKADKVRHHQRRLDQVSSNARGASVALPVNMLSAGIYLAKIKIGTPPQDFVVLIDTGSDLLWVHCKHECPPNDCHTQKKNANHTSFLAYRSSSFKSIPCSSDVCKIKTQQHGKSNSCTESDSPCRYSYDYADNKTALGFYARDILTLALNDGREKRVQGVIGCTETVEQNNLASEKLDGILGLGISYRSFITSTTKLPGGKFSYCLVYPFQFQPTTKTTSFLTIGDSKHKLPSLSSSMQYTKFVSYYELLPLYFVALKGISVDGVMVNVPRWKLRGETSLSHNAIIDSGASFLRLVKEAYKPVMALIEKSLPKLPRLLNLGHENWSEYCYNISASGFDYSKAPKLVFHFEDGAQFQAQEKGYLVTDTGEATGEVMCVAIEPTGDPFNTIGSWIAYHYVWKFDLQGTEPSPIGDAAYGRLGFAPSTCTYA